MRFTRSGGWLGGAPTWADEAEYAEARLWGLLGDGLGGTIRPDIRAWVGGWNDNPKPFIWTKSAEQILESLGRLLTRISGAGH